MKITKLKPTAEFEEVMNEVEKITKYISHRSLKYWRDYTLSEAKLSRKYQQSELEKRFNVKLEPIEPINKIKLVYIAYDGLLAICPGDDESYFNLNTEDPYDDPEKNDREIYKLWTKLINI